MDGHDSFSHTAVEPTVSSMVPSRPMQNITFSGGGGGGLEPSRTKIFGVQCISLECD